MAQLSVQYLASFLAWTMVAVILIGSVLIYSKYMLAASTSLYVKSYALLLMTELSTASAAPEGSTLVIPVKTGGLPENTTVYIVQTEKYRELVINSTYEDMFGRKVTKIYTFPFVGMFATHYDPDAQKYFTVYTTRVTEVNGQYVYCAYSPYSPYRVCEDAIQMSVYDPEHIKYASGGYNEVKWIIEIPNKYITVMKKDGLLVITGGED